MEKVNTVYLMLSSVKVPQILKIVYASSAAGLSFASSCMELMAITGSLAYGFAMGFPFRLVYFFRCHKVLTIQFLFSSCRSYLGIIYLSYSIYIIQYDMR